MLLADAANRMSEGFALACLLSFAWLVGTEEMGNIKVDSVVMTVVSQVR